jgi:hypothetical protein
VAKWQTQLTQNQPRLKPRVGSTPTFGRFFSAFRFSIFGAGEHRICAHCVPRTEKLLQKFSALAKGAELAELDPIVVQWQKGQAERRLSEDEIEPSTIQVTALQLPLVSRLCSS